MVLNGWQLFSGGLVLLIMGGSLGGQMPYITLSSIGLILYLAALSAIAFTLWFMMFAYHSPARLAIFKFSVPIFGSLLSILLIAGEQFTPELIGSLTLVSLGIVAVNLRKRKPKVH